MLNIIIRHINEETRINSAQRDGWDTKVRGYDSYLEDTDEAAKIMHDAKTEQELIHTISS